MGLIIFFKNAFSDMKEDAKAQHEVDRAQLAAVKAEAKARHAQAVAMSDPQARKRAKQAQRAAQIAEANKRTEQAQAHSKP